MFRFLRRLIDRRRATTEFVRGPDLVVVSDAIWLADPNDVVLEAGEPAIRLEGLTPGRVSTGFEILTHPQGGSRVSAMVLLLSPEEPDARRKIGEIAVETARAIVIDEHVFKERWRFEGDARLGRTLAGSKDEVAELIRKRFGLKWRKLDFFRNQFHDPISPALEQEILDYLATIPEYSNYPYMYFNVHTSGTADQIAEALSDASIASLPLDPSSGGNVVAVRTGYGDGTYEVSGEYRGDRLAFVEIRFIGKAQDRILEAFPMLAHPSLEDWEKSRR